MKKNSRLVYSTEHGRIKPEAEQKPNRSISSDGVIRVSRESKGRNGKPVSIISGLNMDASALKTLAKSLKQLCGTGGTIKDGNIEIQGDNRDKIIDYLKGKELNVKKSGG